MRILPVCLACLAAAACAGGGASGPDPDAGPDAGPELAVDVSCGGKSCAITERGAVECWGGCSGCSEGECNPGFPCQIQGVESGAIALDLGHSHACVAMEDGSVRCWGSNVNGQLGGNCSDGICEVSGLDSPCVQIAAGYSASCSLSDEGKVQCWGSVELDYWLPPQTIGGWESGVDKLSVDGREAIAVTESGAVESWRTSCPYLVPSEDCPAPPAAVEGLPGPAVDADLGSRAACALLESGSLMCWGDNHWGQLGDGTTEDRDEPVPVVGLDGVQIVGFTMGSVGSHACALAEDGRVFCWGENQRGQVGNGEISDELSAWKVTEPSEVVGLPEPIVSVSAGAGHTCAAGASGAVYCWGYNSDGQLGNGRDRSNCESDDDSCQSPEWTDACSCPTPVRVIGLGPEPEGGWPEPIEDGY